MSFKSRVDLAGCIDSAQLAGLFDDAFGAWQPGTAGCDERRQTPRVPGKGVGSRPAKPIFVVGYAFEGATSELNCRAPIVDVSADGMGIKLAYAIPVGAIMCFAFENTTGGYNYDVAQVARCSKRKRKFHVGLAFVESARTLDVDGESVAQQAESAPTGSAQSLVQALSWVVLAGCRVARGARIGGGYLWRQFFACCMAIGGFCRGLCESPRRRRKSAKSLGRVGGHRAVLRDRCDQALARAWQNLNARPRTSHPPAIDRALLVMQLERAAHKVTRFIGGLFRACGADRSSRREIERVVYDCRATLVVDVKAFHYEASLLVHGRRVARQAGMLRDRFRHVFSDSAMPTLVHLQGGGFAGWATLAPASVLDCNLDVCTTLKAEITGRLRKPSSQSDDEQRTADDLAAMLRKVSAV